MKRSVPCFVGLCHSPSSWDAIVHLSVSMPKNLRSSDVGGIANRVDPRHLCSEFHLNTRRESNIGNDFGCHLKKKKLLDERRGDEVEQRTGGYFYRLPRACRRACSGPLAIIILIFCGTTTVLPAQAFLQTLSICSAGLLQDDIPSAL